MKASIVEKVGGTFKTVNIEIDQPKGFEVLIDVKAAGLCHSDLHLREHGYGYPFPVLLGHELAGVVEAVGSEVTEFAVGDHVVGCLIQYCGQCQNCLSGKTYVCMRPEATLRKATDSPRLFSTDQSTPLYQGFGLGAFAEKAHIPCPNCNSFLKAGRVAE